MKAMNKSVRSGKIYDKVDMFKPQATRQSN